MAADTRPVFFFDIDNTLYSKSKKIQDLMSDLIDLLSTTDKYFMEHLSMSNEDATHLHNRYYKDYGLAIDGLVRHHKVDPLEYNSKVDDKLPLEGILTPDAELRQLISDFDKSKVRLWLFTNAYVNHGKRVATLLNVLDLFEGITYCDYAAAKFICKPHPEMFAQAQRDAGIADPSQCYFVDDSALNCKAASALGWKTVHFDENSNHSDEKVADHSIKTLYQLRDVYPEMFKQQA